MSEVSAQQPVQRFVDDLIRWFAGRTKASLTAASIICIAIFWFLGFITGIPIDRGFNSSLLAQSSALLALLTAGVGFVGCALLMSVLQARGEVEDPLFPACAGLIGLSCRGGTMTSLLQMLSLNVLWLMIFELLLLFLLITATGQLLTRLYHRRKSAPVLTDPSDWSERLMCMLVTTLIMGLCMYLLAQTDDKKQVLAAVGISAFVGAAAAYTIFDIHVIACYAAAPLVIGLLGYLVAIFMPGAWQTGRIGQPLAYPLPLDYAGLGTAGALLGYWSGQKWKAEENA